MNLKFPKVKIPLKRSTSSHGYIQMVYLLSSSLLVYSLLPSRVELLDLGDMELVNQTAAIYIYTAKKKKNYSQNLYLRPVLKDAKNKFVTPLLLSFIQVCFEVLLLIMGFQLWPLHGQHCLMLSLQKLLLEFPAGSFVLFPGMLNQNIIGQ